MKIQNYLADTFSLWIKNLVWYDEFCTRIIDKQKARIYIVMEFCEYGDLATVIKQSMRRGELIPEDTAWKVFSQVVEALEWCHTRPEGVILHRDIKPENVFLDANSKVKLGDFGLARVLKGNDLARTHVGTPYYMSPEQVQGNWSAAGVGWWVGR